MLSRLTASLLQYLDQAEESVFARRIGRHTNSGFLILTRARRLQNDLGEVERAVVDKTFRVYIWQVTTSYMFIDVPDGDPHTYHDVLESFLYVLMLSFSRAGPLSKAESNFGSTRVHPVRLDQVSFHVGRTTRNVIIGHKETYMLGRSVCLTTNGLKVTH